MPHTRKTRSCAELTALTLDEAEQLAEAVLLDIMDNSRAVARVLLLYHLLVHTREMSDRENIMTRIEKACAPFLPSYTDTLHVDMGDALDELRNLTNEKRNAAPGDWDNHQAGVRLASLLANPQTDATLRDKLDSALLEFTSQAGVYVGHPALAERAFALAADEMSKRRRGKYAKQETAHRRETYATIIALLDEAEG